MQVFQVLFSLLQFGEQKLVQDILDLLKKTADKPEEFAILCKFYNQLGRCADAITTGKNALACDDKNLKIEMFTELIRAYKIANEPTEAIKCMEEIEALAEVDKNFSNIEKSICYYDNNQKDKSYEILKEIDVANLNDQMKVKYFAALAPHQLRNNEFREGIKNVIITQDANKFIQYGHRYHDRSQLPLQFWEGTPDCKKLIVYLEAGLGDEVINLRFMKNLKDMGIDAYLYNIWYEEPEKNKRVGNLDFYEANGFQVIRKFELEKFKDFQWTYSQYLPILLNVDEKDLWTGPYLQAKKLKLKGKKKIGLRWAGNQYPLHRNFKLADIYSSIKHLDATFYSLQRDECLNELEEFPEIVDLSDKLTTMADLANYTKSLDLLITCPTLTCTIAGALDTPCITLVQCSDYYIFNTKNNNTPWYGKNMQLLRQKKPNSWSDIGKDLLKLIEKKLYS